MAASYVEFSVRFDEEVAQETRVFIGTDDSRSHSLISRHFVMKEKLDLCVNSLRHSGVQGKVSFEFCSSHIQSSLDIPRKDMTFSSLVLCKASSVQA